MNILENCIDLLWDVKGVEFINILKENINKGMSLNDRVECQEFYNYLDIAVTKNDIHIIDWIINNTEIDELSKKSAIYTIFVSYFRYDIDIDVDYLMLLISKLNIDINMIFDKEFYKMYYNCTKYCKSYNLLFYFIKFGLYESAKVLIDLDIDLRYSTKDGINVLTLLVEASLDFTDWKNADKRDIIIDLTNYIFNKLK